jgi:hypothetical protein
MTDQDNDDMTDQDNDDEIRESIPCVTVWMGDDDVLCLPVGYTLDNLCAYCRGVYTGYRGVDGAWQHAIEREKARRAKAKEQGDSRKRVAERIREVAAAVRDGICDEEEFNAIMSVATMIETGVLP